MNKSRYLNIFGTLMRNQLKLLLILSSVLLGGIEVVRRVETLTNPDIQIPGLAAYGLLFLLCVISVVGTGFFVRAWLRWPLAIAFAGASWLVDGYQWVVGDFMTYDGFVTMTQSTGDLGSAFDQQTAIMLMAAGKSAFLLFGIGLRPTSPIPWAGRIAKLVAFPFLALLVTLLYFRGGEGASGLPSGHSGLSFSILQGYELIRYPDGERKAVTLPKGTAKPSGDVVLIIDESIAGAYLDINDPNGVYSGLNRSASPVPIHNFGLAASIAHCSVGSNMSLRYGGTRANYLDMARSGPAIWSYARTAGLETIYIDAQRTGGIYQNQMNDAERQEIDHWDQFDNVPVIDRDQAVADRLTRYLGDGKAQFILINKVGAHFPVNDKFPDSHARYKPMLERRQYADVTDMAAPDALYGRDGNWVLYRNSYRNTLTWNVGGFFDRLFDQAKLTGATIIYTADHGQHLHEQPDSGAATHCTPNPEIEEGVVPLVVIGGSGIGDKSWEQAAKARHDGMSHYRIFPTLLSLMGYEQQAIKAVYGPDLLSPEADPFTFNIRYNARLGSSPIWKHIPVEDVARPPVSDHVDGARSTE
ncbi:sulfatase-like hydrolase/transferase [Parasphingorhabdus cellanae]|uniref:Sulfatase-like hydrolase/transferase n=1 Tax=Parasphingorhabdus cellanae TaxID=2806553 RepID=A0ABX7T177_9SPHN|nr:sulfatase-like hydrolase/transferase [Parasphingorhabdus cellanae]QTD54517.1 sulfatase-like hydrolase/transferase [Parasphingorhabdus cellanae]